MANMSATILRNIVSSTLKVDSRKIKLSGEASENLVLQNFDTANYDRRYCETNLFYFSPQRGLKLFPLMKTVSLKEISKALDLQESLFIVVWEEGCTQMQNPQDHDYFENITLFKSPNFKEIYESYEKEEVARWEQWMQE